MRKEEYLPGIRHPKKKSLFSSSCIFPVLQSLPGLGERQRGKFH
jgi:hypothetical protein